MISDITPLIEAQRKAEEANRSKTSFIANLSHEIRTPMNATIGYIYLLEQTKLTEEQKKYLEKMDYASNTLLEIIDEILDFSKIEADKVTIENISFNLHHLLQNAISMFENTAFRKELQLIWSIGPKVPVYVIGDSHKIRQIIINLLSNAFKFTSFGHVSVKVMLISEEESRISKLEPDTFIVKVAIEDTGIGIPKERMDILFDPFVQADESTTRIYGGTGLGLAICKRLIQIIGGHVYAESQEGKGSTFTIEVPFAIAKEIDQIDEKIKPNYLSMKREKKILIVEDNPLNQELLVELLRLQNNRVVVANNGKVAEKILTSRHKTKFDLILMDIQMPIQDGYTTTKNIRKETQYSNVPIIAITANADKETQIHLAEAGMNDLLLKPINAADLYKKIGMW
jgi:CheY-like chemotaxis protein